MSNKPKQAPGTSTNKKVRKVIVQKNQEMSQLRFQLLNMRQMYEGAIQEKLSLQQQANQWHQALAAAVIQAGKKGLRITAQTLENLPEAGRVVSEPHPKGGSVLKVVEADPEGLLDGLDVDDEPVSEEGPDERDSEDE